jgi:hypothetical protein
MTDAGHFWIYFDIETTGTDEKKDKIITVQYQTLCYDLEGKRHDCNIQDVPPSTLTILKEWESDEKTILQQAFEVLQLNRSRDRRHWFEPVGNVLSFEGKFLKSRLINHGIIESHLKFGHLTLMDLRPLMILVNDGNYDTAKFFGKVGKNKLVPVWYREKEYDKIEEYVREEAESFGKTFDYLVANLPKHKEAILALHGNNILHSPQS